MVLLATAPVFLALSKQIHIFTVLFAFQYLTAYLVEVLLGFFRDLEIAIIFTSTRIANAKMINKVRPGIGIKRGTIIITNINQLGISNANVAAFKKDIKKSIGKIILAAIEIHEIISDSKKLGFKTKITSKTINDNNIDRYIQRDFRISLSIKVSAALNISTSFVVLTSFYF